MYYAPLSSPKEKHIKLKPKLGLLKINYGKYGVINFNNMIPVTNWNIKKIDLKVKLTSHNKNYIKLYKNNYFG